MMAIRQKNGGFWFPPSTAITTSRRLLNPEQKFFIRAAAHIQNYHFISVTRVIGVVSLPVDKLLDVGPQIPVLR